MGKPCNIKWVEKMFKEYLSNLYNEISFGLGIASLVCWVVAEIPQIITNFNSKSASGVSLAFLSTWIIGDVFNLVGCILEPTTLPTQFYTALFYTIVTIILALQCIYYTYILGWLNRNKNEPKRTETKRDREGADLLLPNFDGQISKYTRNAPIEIPCRREFHFTSARSLAGSDTPPFQNYMKAKSGPPVLDHHLDSSSEEEGEGEEPESTISIPPHFNNKPVSLPRPIPRPVKYGMFAAASANLPRLSRALTEIYGARLSELKEQNLHENAYGQWLGWSMAIIYMGGRLPQIWLNIKRGSVEGLNPLMFVFALSANATYAASILVITTESRMIKGNLPWLLDAIVCVVLDLYIILQYIFYKYIKPKRSDDAEGCGEYYYRDYGETNKPT